MEWKRFRFLNNVVGWGVFAVAAIVYLMTIEPTASLWDCAEFIVCVNKLEIGHPPGAPFFMLVYNIISHFMACQCYQCTGQCLYHPVFVLDDYPPCPPRTCTDSTQCIRIGRAVKENIRSTSNHDTRQWSRWSLGLYVQRYVLVQCRRGRGICIEFFLHGCRFLADA